MIDYDPRHWRSHFLDVHGSMLREILYRVGFCVLAAIVAVALVHVGRPVYFPEQPHLFIGPALALLLVFRTNAANDRYWEGRRLWGGIVNATRNLSRKANALLGSEPDLVRELEEWAIAFSWAARERLRDRRGLGPRPRLPDDAITAAMDEPHVALAATRRLTGLIADAQRRGLVSDVQQMALDADVQALVEHLGGCERIHSTPLPFAYVVHLRRALLLYCGALPFVLVQKLGVYTVPATLAVAYVLIGIEEIGVEIENPFGDKHNDLPLDRICTSLQDMLRASRDAQKASP